MGGSDQPVIDSMKNERTPGQFSKIASALHRLGIAAISLFAFHSLFALPPCAAADRTTCLVPQPSTAKGGPAPAGVYADQAYGVPPDNGSAVAETGASDGWRSYIRVWKTHHEDPSDAGVRRFLGLPLDGVVEAQPRRGRAAPGWLGWRAGSYQQILTPHFTILSRAKTVESKRVAQDLERCYWIWTQMFFPFWEAAPQVSTVLRDLGDGDVSEFLKKRTSRITLRRKLRVVFFRDAAEYRRTLARQVPGIERSTGYYNDAEQTIFLYASPVDDAATRRHEMVHQLFREATRSGLARDMPGEQSGFWLVEGIAGYFESLKVGSRMATVGGWDSPRLQFARFRMVTFGDRMTMDELRRDGREAAQRRDDLARWYAHAITQSHRLMDGGDQSERQWIYRQLADTYKVGGEFAAGKLSEDAERRLDPFLRIDDDLLRANRIAIGPPSLCLSGCRVTAEGIKTIPPSRTIDWLDLSRLPVGNKEVEGLTTDPRSLRRLSLEGTRIDSGIDPWLAKATNLQEVDLSMTGINDSSVVALRKADELELLYLTGSKKITDASIETLAEMKQLDSVDLQRTGVTPAGIERLRKLRPKLTLNPLEIRTQ